MLKDLLRCSKCGVCKGMYVYLSDIPADFKNDIEHVLSIWYCRFYVLSIKNQWRCSKYSVF